MVSFHSSHHIHTHQNQSRRRSCKIELVVVVVWYIIQWHFYTNNKNWEIVNKCPGVHNKVKV